MLNIFRTGTITRLSSQFAKTNSKFTTKTNGIGCIFPKISNNSQRALCMATGVSLFGASVFGSYALYDKCDLAIIEKNKIHFFGAYSAMSYASVPLMISACSYVIYEDFNLFLNNVKSTNPSCCKLIGRSGIRAGLYCFSILATIGYCYISSQFFSEIYRDHYKQYHNKYIDMIVRKE